MKSNLPELDFIFLSATHHDADKCYNFLKTNHTIKESIKIKANYWIAGHGDNQSDVRDDMILIVFCDSRADFDKLRAELQYFDKVINRYIFSNKEEARTWVNEVPDSDLRVFIGLKEDTILGFRDVLRLAVPGIKEGLENF